MVSRDWHVHVSSFTLKSVCVRIHMLVESVKCFIYKYHYTVIKKKYIIFDFFILGEEPQFHTNFVLESSRYTAVRSKKDQWTKY